MQAQAKASCSQTLGIRPRLRIPAVAAIQVDALQAPPPVKRVPVAAYCDLKGNPRSGQELVISARVGTHRVAAITPSERMGNSFKIQAITDTSEE